MERKYILLFFYINIFSINLSLAFGDKSNIGIKAGVTKVTNLPSNQYSIIDDINPYLGALLDVKLNENLEFNTGITYNRLNYALIAQQGIPGMIEIKHYFIVKSLALQAPLNLEWKIYKFKSLPFSICGVSGLTLGYNRINSYNHDEVFKLIIPSSGASTGSIKGIIANKNYFNFYLNAGLTFKYEKAGKRIVDVNLIYSQALTSSPSFNYEVNKLNYIIPDLNNDADPSAVSSFGSINKIEEKLSPNLNLLQVGLTWYIFK